MAIIINLDEKISLYFRNSYKDETTIKENGNSFKFI
jgi:hypothetical protein